MRKLFIFVLCLAFFFVLAACGSSENGAENGELEQDIEVNGEEQSESVETAGEDSDTIILQSIIVTVPPGHSGTGGHDGVKYNNAIITPDNENMNYEIEVGFGGGHTSSDYEGVMSLRGIYFDATVVPVDTEGWNIEGLAYTYIKTHGDSMSSITDFKEEYGPSQVVGIFRYEPYGEGANHYNEIEMRVTEGSVEDYPDVLESFAANYLEWRDPEE